MAEEEQRRRSFGYNRKEKMCLGFKVLEKARPRLIDNASPKITWTVSIEKKSFRFYDCIVSILTVTSEDLLIMSNIVTLFFNNHIIQMKVDPRSYERNYMQLRKEA